MEGEKTGNLGGQLFPKNLPVLQIANAMLPICYIFKQFWQHVPAFIALLNNSPLSTPNGSLIFIDCKNDRSPSPLLGVEQPFPTAVGLRFGGIIAGHPLPAAPPRQSEYSL
jgi:hypothetical protein